MKILWISLMALAVSACSKKDSAEKSAPTEEAKETTTEKPAPDPEAKEEPAKEVPAAPSDSKDSFRKHLLDDNNMFKNTKSLWVYDKRVDPAPEGKCDDEAAKFARNTVGEIRKALGSDPPDLEIQCDDTAGWCDLRSDAEKTITRIVPAFEDMQGLSIILTVSTEGAKASTPITAEDMEMLREEEPCL